MKHKNEKIRLLVLTSKLLLRRFDILLELPNCVFQRRPGIIDLVHDQDVFSNQVVHFQGAKVQPLCASDLGAWDLLRITTAQVLVKRQADGLNRDVRLTGAFQE